MEGRAPATRFGAGARVFEHDGGHIVPMDADALDTYKAFLDVK